MDELTINERIRELRTENGLTQKQLADAVGTSQTTVASHERSHDPNIYILIKYADYFGCTLDYLAGRDRAPLPYALTEEERELVRLFRSLKPSAKEYAREQMKLLSSSPLNRP